VIEFHRGAEEPRVSHFLMNDVSTARPPRETPRHQS
jgi:hypothetical protein